MPLTPDLDQEQLLRPQRRQLRPGPAARYRHCPGPRQQEPRRAGTVRSAATAGWRSLPTSRSPDQAHSHAGCRASRPGTRITFAARASEREVLTSRRAGLVPGAARHDGSAR